MENIQAFSFSKFIYTLDKFGAIFKQVVVVVVVLVFLYPPFLYTKVGMLSIKECSSSALARQFKIQILTQQDQEYRQIGRTAYILNNWFKTLLKGLKSSSLTVLLLISFHCIIEFSMLYSTSEIRGKFSIISRIWMDSIFA